MIDDCQLPILLNLAHTALTLAGQSRGSHKQLRAAVSYCTRALALKPDSVKALYRRGLARERSEDAEEAVIDLRKARQLLGGATASPGQVWVQISIYSLAWVNF